MSDKTSSAMTCHVESMQILQCRQRESSLTRWKSRNQRPGRMNGKDTQSLGCFFWKPPKSGVRCPPPSSSCCRPRPRDGVMENGHQASALARSWRQVRWNGTPPLSDSLRRFRRSSDSRLPCWSSAAGRYQRPSPREIDSPHAMQVGVMLFIAFFVSLKTPLPNLFGRSATSVQVLDCKSLLQSNLTA